MSNQVTHTQQEEGFLDFNKFFKIIRRNWYLFALSLALSFGVVYMYLKYTIPIYSVSAKVFIKDRSSHAWGSSNFLEGAQMFAPYNNLENEMIFMKSNTMMRRTMQQLDFGYSYYSSGTIKDIEAYPFKQFQVIPDTMTPQITNTKIYVSALSDSTFEIKIDTESPTFYNRIDDTRSYSKNSYLNFKTQGTFGKPVHIENSIFTLQKDSFLTYQIGHVYYFVAQDIESQIRYWQGKTSVIPVNKEASIVNIGVNGPNLNKCIAFSNMLARVYINQGLVEKNQIAVNTINFIDYQLHVIKDSLNVVESDLVDFRSKNKVMDINYEAQIDYTKLKELESERAKLNIRQKYFQYIREYVSAEKDYTALVVPSTLDINDPNLNSLIGELIALGNDKQTVMKNSSSPNNPFLKNIESQIRYTKDALLENLNNLNRATEISMSELSKNIASIQLGLSKLPVTEREFLNIERKFNVNDGIYNYLLEKRAEASIAKASSTPDNKLIDVANIYDGGMISPKSKTLYTSSIIAALFLPLLFCLYVYFTDNKIYTKEDIEEFSSVPFIGSVVHSLAATGNSVLDKPKSGLSESFRSIKLNLDFILKQKKGLIIGVTSFSSGEGKTFIAINLASIYSIAGKKVVLIGMDLRKPRIDKELFEDKETGLSNYLAGMVEMKKIIQPSKKHENMFFIPSGVIPPNPSELLSSTKMYELIAYLKTEFDVIILDSLHIGLVVDYLNVIKQVDVTTYIVRQGMTAKQSLAIINELSAKEDVPNACIILNDARAEHNKYNSYGMGYYYGAYSGYYEEGDQKPSKIQAFIAGFKNFVTKKQS